MARFKGLRLDASRLGGSAPTSKSGAEMVHVGVTFTTTLIYGVDMTKVLGQRNLNKHRRQAGKEVLVYWHQNLRDKHFTSEGFSEYKYQRRARATVDIKKKKLGHNLPIVMAGDAWAMTGNIKSLRGTPNKASLTMAGPWYLGQRVKRKDGKMSPDLKSELTAVSARDALLMARFGAKHIREGIKADKKSKLGARIAKLAKP